jgi:hypothetical protein
VGSRFKVVASITVPVVAESGRVNGRDSVTETASTPTAVSCQSTLTAAASFWRTITRRVAGSTPA